MNRYFLPDVPTLWVDGDAFEFEQGYSDGAGSYLDVYANTTVGTLRLSGSTSGEAHVTGNSHQTFFEGTLSAGLFEVSGGVIVAQITATEPFTPRPLWVRGVYYGQVVLNTDEQPTNVYTTASSSAHSITFTPGANTGEWQVTGLYPDGTTFGGTLASVPGGVFLLAASGGGYYPALTVETGGLLSGAGAVLSESDEPLPAAICVENRVASYVYLGTSADDSAPAVDVAWYGQADAAGCRRLIKIGASNVTVMDYDEEGVKTETSGTYDRGTYLFHTSGASALVDRLYASVVRDSDVRRLLDWSGAGGLPPSFVVRGQSWWFAGYDSGVATYHGFYAGQEMTLGVADASGQRLVDLVDPTSHGGAATSGTLSAERGSVRFRDGTLALWGTDSAGTAETITHEDDYALYTIRSDVDIVGNNVSFGVMDGDASLAGALLAFRDDGVRASLHSSLSRSSAEWFWWRQDANVDTLRKVMWLDESHRLKLHPVDGADTPAIILDPGGVSSFTHPVRIPPGGDIPMAGFQEGGAP